MLDGERVMAKSFFKHKDEARQWIKDEKEEWKNRKRSSLKDKETDLFFWTLAQKYLADCKTNYDKKTVDEKNTVLSVFTSSWAM